MTKCHCGKDASYNYPLLKAKFCSIHKDINMTDVKNKKCEISNCIIQANYNFSGEKNARFCNEHKHENMIDIKNTRCEINGCRKQPNYNFSTETKKRFCNEHKHENMIDVRNKRCIIIGCTKYPSYNYPGEKKRSFCNDHKDPTMINVKDKRCEIVGCIKIPCYNTQGKVNGRFCSNHKESNMINIRNSNKTCIIDGCITEACFNISGKKHGCYCNKHKLPNMINIYNKHCEFNECTTIPLYNFHEEKKGRFCSIHKLINMVNVKDKQCQINGCTIQRTYGWLGKNPSHCTSHKEKGMIKTPTKKCSTCKQLGTYEANSIRYCENHKPNDSTNLGLQKCSLCGLDNILIDETCNDCNPVIVELYQHAKENHIRDILHANGLNTFIHDKMLEGPACGRERPDFQFDCGTHFVYLEVDENQHRSYPCECEQTRMINLVEVRGMPVRFIRYNPDSYQPVNGQFMLTTHLREKKLIEYVNYAIKHSPQEENNIADVLYLCYDEYDIINHIWNKLI